MSKFDKYQPGTDITKRAYSWNIVYPPYMAKMASIVYNLEDFEKNYAYVEAVFVNLDREDR